MAQYFEIHPDNPQPRLLRQAAALIAGGGVIAAPTDSSYALVCQLDDRAAVEQIRLLRQIDERHHLSLLCCDLAQLAQFARVDNRQFRMLKLGTPGAYTFILQASKEVPRRMSHPQRKTIGLRVPAHKVAQALLQEYGAPLLASTLIPPGEDDPLNDPQDINARFGKQLAAIIDAGACPAQASTIVDLTPMDTGGEPEVLRVGRGALSVLGL